MIKLNNNTVAAGKKGNEKMNVMEMLEMQKDVYMQPLYQGVGAINKEAIESMNRNIACDKIENKSKALAVMSYSFGSLVGVTTTGVNLGLTILSNADQFFNDGQLSLTKIRKVFKKLGAEYERGYKYQPVFNRANKATVLNKFGSALELVRVSAHEVREFDARIKRIDVYCCTKEDLVLIAKDLDIIGRAMQELAIDVTKDKSKDIGYNIMSFIQAKTKTHSRIVAAGNFVNNIGDIIDNHYGKKAVPSYSVAPSFVKIADADEENKSAMSSAVVEDVAGSLMEEINDGYTRAMNKLFDSYKLSHNKMYSKYFNLIEIAKRADDESSLKIAHLLKCSVIAMSSITSLYGLKDGDASVNGAYIKEVGKKLRAGLYTEGSKLGLTPQAVVEIAIAGSFCYIENNKIADKKKPSFTQLWTIFDKEFVIEYLNINGEATIKDMLTVKYTNYDLCLGDKLIFDNGLAITEYGTVKVQESYTGDAVVTEDGIEAVVDHYAYEPTEVIFLDNVYERNIINLVPGQGYERPKNVIVRSKDNKDMLFNQAISKMIFSSEQSKVATNSNVRDFIIKKGNKISIIGTVLSAGNNTGKIDHAIITNGSGGVVFFK